MNQVPALNDHLTDEARWRLWRLSTGAMSPLVLRGAPKACQQAEQALCEQAREEGYTTLQIDASASCDVLATLRDQAAALTAAELGEAVVRLASWQWADYLDDLHEITDRPTLIVVSALDAIADRPNPDVVCASLRSAIQQRRKWLYLVLSGVAHGALARWLQDHSHPIYELGPVEYLRGE
ncbi:hypothetical protein KHP57_02180 [Algiphilus sp. NNCM1]|uniref:hypothetical protein n=1 Tax=Algiphilus sp. TaxID=1872431 RepID=UPI0025C52C47|nr:hypothetical protein [Algiphilus sp.]MBY8964498.1 hypothetical protein [Algiphilus acroporae]MCI5103181.1 hypothetical protein [Algiphilus sp.]MCK5770654.1 hypothetical protein [Algiphilus sp.]